MEKGGMILCDTEIIIELYRNNEQIISELKKIGEENIAISAITAGELFFGALNKSELKQIEKDIKSLDLKLIDEEISKVFYNLLFEYSLSHKIGIPDAFIASTAIVNDLELFNLNVKHFKFIKGLKLYQIK
jgi:predicted nucleic acid-binding protein